MKERSLKFDFKIKLFRFVSFLFIFHFPLLGFNIKREFGYFKRKNKNKARKLISIIDYLLVTCHLFCSNDIS